MDHHILDTILKERMRLAMGLQALPLWYRLSPETVQRITPPPRHPLPDEVPWPDLDANGRIWGIPYSVSEEVPDGEVWFTTDYKVWHKIVGVGK